MGQALFLSCEQYDCPAKYGAIPRPDLPSGCHRESPNFVVVRITEDDFRRLGINGNIHKSICSLLVPNALRRYVGTLWHRRTAESPANEVGYLGFLEYLKEMIMTGDDHVYIVFLKQRSDALDSFLVVPPVPAIRDRPR